MKFFKNKKQRPLQMAEAVGAKINEITINLKRLTKYCKSNRKSSGAIKSLRKFIQKQYKTRNPVYISEDLNKKIWERGTDRTVCRIRIRVERGKCLVNPENDCIRLSLVEVNSFKGLKDSIVDE